MAADLDLLTSFVNGQGAGAGSYVVYAEDLDSNFAAIQSNFNSLNQEVRSFGGNNAALSTDLILSSDPPIATGFVGADSFAPVAFLTADTQISIPLGTAFTATLGRLQSNQPVTFTGSGASGDRFFALQGDGSITQETAALQGVMDLYSVTWDGAVFTTATLLRLEEILVDGDDFQSQRSQEEFGQGSDAAIPAFSYDQIARRFDDVVRVMGGESASADANQAALGPMAFAGAVATPGFIPGNGTDYEPDAGLYRASAIAWGASLGGLTAWELRTILEPQLAVRGGTVLASPNYTFTTDLDTGLGWVVADEYRLIAGSLEVARIFNDAGSVGFGLAPGSATNPSLTFQAERDKGLYHSATDSVGLATNGLAAAEWNASQQRTSPTQGRSSASRATFNIANNAITAVDLTAEEYDIGSYHDNGVNPDRMTVPAGGDFDGNYSVKGTVTFEESTSATPNVGDRGVQITLNGAVVAEARFDAVITGDSAGCPAIDLDLVAGDIVRVTAFQDSGNTMDVSARLTLRLED